jgi:hypothetical protein
MMEKEAALFNSSASRYQHLADTGKKMPMFGGGRQARWDRAMAPAAPSAASPAAAKSSLNPTQAKRLKELKANKAARTAKAAPAPAAATKAAPAAGKGLGRLARGGAAGVAAGALGYGAYRLATRQKAAQVLRERLFNRMATAPDREKMAQVFLEGEEAAGEALRRCFS